MITEEEILHLAHLARLELTDEQIKELPQQIKQILEYFDIINQVDTKDVKPSFHVHDIFNHFRADKEKKCSSDIVKRILSNAPSLEDNYFKTKSVFEN